MATETQQAHADKAAADKQAATDKEAAAAQAKADAETKKQAELEAHPHSRLLKILQTVQAPVHDINERIGNLQQGLARLTEIVLGFTKPPAQGDK